MPHRGQHFFYKKKYRANVSKALFLLSSQSPAIKSSRIMMRRSAVSRFLGSSCLKKPVMLSGLPEAFLGQLRGWGSGCNGSQGRSGGGGAGQASCLGFGGGDCGCLPD